MNKYKVIFFRAWGSVTTYLPNYESAKDFAHNMGGIVLHA